MSDEPEDGRKKAERSVELSVNLPASPAEVWQAITDAEALRSWFPIDARITPAPDRRIWLSWGADCEGEAPIHAWEPERHFGWTEDHGSRLVAVDFFLEGERGGTKLRLVQSGFGVGASFDDEYDSTSRGWRYELSSLRHYLEHHRSSARGSSARVGLWVRASEPVAPALAWQGLLGDDGLGLTVEDGRFALRGPAGLGLSGTVHIDAPPKDVSGAVPALGNALWRYVWEGGRPNLWLWIWNGDEGSLAPYRDAWRELFERRFGGAKVN